MSAQASFEAAWKRARFLGEARTRIRDSFDREKDSIRLRTGRPDYDAATLAAEVAALEDRAEATRRSLILAEVAQLLTAWEVFLWQRIEEALSNSPAHLQRLLALDAAPSCTHQTGSAFLEQAVGKYLSSERAEQAYVDLLGLKPLLPEVAAPGVRRLEKLRHMTVHRNGVPSTADQRYFDEFRSLDLSGTSRTDLIPRERRGSELPVR